MKKSKREIREAKETENNYKFTWKFTGETWYTIIPARNELEATREFLELYAVKEEDVTVKEV